MTAMSVRAPKAMPHRIHGSSVPPVSAPSAPKAIYQNPRPDAHVVDPMREQPDKNSQSAKEKQGKQGFH